MTSSPRQDISYFARTDFRNTKRLFGIRQDDRLLHTYVIGKTGVGKSTLLKTLIAQDIAAGRGLAVLDPHGELVESVLPLIPKHREKDLLYFNVPDAEQPYRFNPVESVPESRMGLAASGLLDAFKKQWADSWGPRLEHILRNTIFALLEHPGTTLADALRLYTDRDFRKQITANIKNPQVRRFWQDEFEGYTDRLRAEAVAPIQNKLGALLTDSTLNRILAAPKSTLRLRAAMDEGKILLVNLSKGKIGEDVAGLLGALLVSRINLAALSRADLPAENRKPFFCYLDEFQTFTSLTFVTMLSELRKYGVGMVLAHQYLAQLEEAVRDAILGNVGTTLVFRVGAADAEIFEREFAPQFRIEDFANLPNHGLYLKLMIDGQVSPPFSAKSITPAELPAQLSLDKPAPN